MLTEVPAYTTDVILYFRWEITWTSVRQDDQKMDDSTMDFSGYMA